MGNSLKKPKRLQKEYVNYKIPLLKSQKEQDYIDYRNEVAGEFIDSLIKDGHKCLIFIEQKDPYNITVCWCEMSLCTISHNNFL